MDSEKFIEALENADVTNGVIKMSTQFRDVLVELLKEQDDKIRQLRLALKIMKGNGIRVDKEGLRNEMPDRDKVIKELESIRDICNAKSNMAIGKGKVAWAGYANAVDDALSLLKEQEQKLNELEEKLRLLEYGDQDTLQSAMMPAT